MNIQTIPLARLHPARYNPRADLKPGDPEYDMLAKGIGEFGLVVPLVWNKRSGNLVGGHQRLKVLKQAGIKEVQVSVVDLPDDKEQALNIALNKISGEWDMPALKDLIEGLDTGDIDMDLTGWTGDELEDLMLQVHQGETEDDAVPEVKKSICKTGDLWELGKHRLLCGDATKAADVARLMGGERADVVVTDPPYGVGVDYHSYKDTEKNLVVIIAGVMPIIQKVPAAAITPGVMNMWLYPRPAWVGAWVHPAAMAPGTWGFNGNNPILYYGADPYLKAGKGSHPDSVVMAADREGVDGHPTPKPMKVWEWLVERMTIKKGQIVFDPFIGSGTTIIACEKTGRRCRGMEIDEHYCDVVIARWQDYTGGRGKKIKKGAKK